MCKAFNKSEIQDLSNINFSLISLLYWKFRLGDEAVVLVAP